MTTKAEQKIKTLKAAIAYEDGLYEDLRNPEFAAEYLNAAFEEENPELFLLALRDVVKANGGVSEMANKTQISRQNIYAMLSEKGNPRFHNLMAILSKLGVKISFEPFVRQN